MGLEFEELRFLQTNEREDVVGSLELARLLLPRTAEEPLLWKWVLIAAHSAVTGAMICALSGTDRTGALRVPDQVRLQKLSRVPFDPQRPPPEVRPASFNELLKWCQTPECMEGQPLLLTPLHVFDLTTLADFRNAWVHFLPVEWSVGLSSLPRLLGVATVHTKRLMLRPQNAAQLNVEQRRRLGSASDEILAEIGAAAIDAAPKDNP